MSEAMAHFERVFALLGRTLLIENSVTLSARYTNTYVGFSAVGFSSCLNETRRGGSELVVCFLGIP